MKPSPVPSETLRHTMGAAHAALGIMPKPHDGEGVSAWLMRWRTAEKKLAAALADSVGAEITGKSSGLTTVRIHGIRASSTGGTTGALRNWIAAADRELARRQQAGGAA